MNSTHTTDHAARFTLVQDHASMFSGCSAATEQQLLDYLLAYMAPELWTVQEWINPESEDADLVQQMNGQEWLRERGHQVR